MHDELMRQVADDPSDVRRWTVFVDWLLARGDPRGRLAVAHEGEREAMLAALAPTWFGADARVEGQRVIVAGDPGDALVGASAVALEFEHGHVRRLQLDIVHGSVDMDEGPRWGRDWIPALIRRILSQPVGQLIQSIEICQHPDWTGELLCDALLDALVEAAPLSARTLAWGCDSDWEFVELPDCALLLAAAPQLESLTLQGVSGLQSGVRHERLRRLGLGAMEDESLATFAKLELPALEDLTLWLEFDDTGEVDSDFAPNRLDPLLAARLPALRSLALPHCPQVDEVLATLPNALWFRGLESLTLVDAELGARSIERLSSSAYAHVRVVTTP